MRITARLSYGLRALAVMATTGGEPIKGPAIVRRLSAPASGDPAAATSGGRAQPGGRLSVGFLEIVLGDLRRAGLVSSKRGGHGGYWLARPADTITVADVIRVLDGEAPDADQAVPADELSPVWTAIVSGYMDAARRITVAELAARHR